MTGFFDPRRIVDLVKDRIANATEAIRLPDLNKMYLKSKRFDVEFDLKNIEVYDVQGFEISKFNTTSQPSTVSWEIQIEQLTVECDYRVEGKHKGKDLTGEGRARALIINYKDSGFARIERRRTQIQVTEFRIRLSVKRVEFEEEGLSFNNMSPRKSKKFIENEIRQLLRKEGNVINDIVSARVKDALNAMLSSGVLKNLASLIQTRN